MLTEYVQLHNNFFTYEELSPHKADLDYPLHIHPEIELMLISDINGQWYIGDKISKFSGTTMVLIGGNTPHKWEFDEFGEIAKIEYLKFKDFTLASLFQEEQLIHLRELFTLSNRGVLFEKEEDKYQVQQLLTKMVNCEGFRQTICFFEIMDHLSKFSPRCICQSPFFSYKNQELSRVDKAIEFITKNYQQEIKLEEVAHMFNLSKSGFCSMIKKNTGKTFSYFVAEIRVLEAKSLLLASDKKINEICYETGFQNVSYFNRCFKEITTYSPNEYRNKYL